MLNAFLVTLVIVGAVWTGWSEGGKKYIVLKLLGLGVVLFLAAISFYGWQCDAASIPDILLFRDVPGQYFCSGRLTLVAYMLVLAVPVAILKAYIDRRSNYESRDI